MNNSHPFKAVIFDIDGTLTPDVSWTALTRDLGGSVEKHLELYRGHRDGTIAYEISKGELLKLWQATGNANKNFFEKLFMDWPFREGAEELVNHLKSKGYLICLITGAVDLYAEVVAKRLGITHFIPNAQFVWDENGKLIDFDYEVKQDEKKLEQFLEFCREQNLDPLDCVVVGDGYNDVKLFSLTGNGIMVRSEGAHHLEDIAWKKVGNLSEIMDLL